MNTLTRFEMFAAMAPTEIPDWFKVDNDHLALKLKDLILSISEKTHAKNKHETLYMESHDPKDDEKVAELNKLTESLMVERYFSWRMHYAEQMCKRTYGN